MSPRFIDFCQNHRLKKIKFSCSLRFQATLRISSSYIVHVPRVQTLHIIIVYKYNVCNVGQDWQIDCSKKAFKFRRGSPHPILVKTVELGAAFSHLDKTFALQFFFHPFSKYVSSFIPRACLTLFSGLFRRIYQDPRAASRTK